MPAVVAAGEGVLAGENGVNHAKSLCRSAHQEREGGMFGETRDGRQEQWRSPH